jgi:fumarylacetoacetase
MRTVLKSWIASANVPRNPFPLQNLPYGVYLAHHGRGHCCLAIGDELVDLTQMEAVGLVDLGQQHRLFADGSLNQFMAAGEPAWRLLRQRLISLLAENGDPGLRVGEALRQDVIRHQAGLTMLMPSKVTEYTDFYAGRRHAENAGAILRGDSVAHAELAEHARRIQRAGVERRNPNANAKVPEAKCHATG